MRKLQQIINRQKSDVPETEDINSYVVKGEKIAIIDLVRDWAGASNYFLRELQSIGIDPKKIDYFILNHFRGISQE